MGDAVLGGWQVTGVTTFKDGFPLGMTASDNTHSFGGNQRPNLIGNPHVSHPAIDQWFNSTNGGPCSTAVSGAAFCQPDPFTFGNVPRFMPNLRAPGLNNWDLAIQKYWHWSEKLRVQFRAEMYNAWNHTNFYQPNTSFGDPNFGTITGANPARDVQLGLKIYW